MRHTIDIGNFWEMVLEKGTYISISTSISVYLYVYLSSTIELARE